ncbi:Branched-chain amino acid transport system permease protein LivM (TC 3.A.1.4.1) [Halanaerobium saccharolyticum subsp. saccharolyticum DSM 6643]|uniref:Branched-chain amino acid transport system permease protein LivM (TC 3.A.1.4.1) n=1 Tax=Halanaerobium saccharolyticum subsp. saccharolyticum DSM 6643 TaxID=1293054 RepID=M5EF48_9FIRM|nr:branched-chain amino acid ABC transporter permease [Halanaerobium saccharolyticum]CCU79741.1 Branched-chain amino acid transport system permease protein LivM (TC 3.A.1.4.1) [Halanaerobium saccharolyticum subsp. saccharolyticum DSM 6643]
MTFAGVFSYLVFFLIFVGIYAIMTLALNIQRGFAGLFNIGIAGFWAVGAYTSAIVTKGPTPDHLGGFGMPFIVGLLTAGLVASVLALLVGIPTIRLREDYLGIATIGIAEIIRLVVKNEAWLTNGVRGVSAIPKPLAGIFGSNYNLFFLLIVITVIVIFYYLSEKGINSPWGRVLRAIREDEEVVKAAGKNVVRYRMEAFILGAFMMGVGGALYAHFTSFISPEAFRPMQATFLVWIMLIIGGSANNFGSIVGAFLTWGIWTGTEFLTGMLPAAYTTQAAAVRVILIGIFLEIILLSRPQGLFGEKKYSSKKTAAEN